MSNVNNPEGQKITDVCYQFKTLLYTQDIYSIIKYEESIPLNLANGEFDEKKCRSIFLNYIDERMNYFFEECSKEPNKIFDGYNMSFNHHEFMERFVEVDSSINAGFYNSIRDRYVICFVDSAHVAMEKPYLLFINSIEVLGANMRKYLPEWNNIAKAAEKDFDDIMEQVKLHSSTVHPQCSRSYDEYLRMISKPSNNSINEFTKCA